MIKHVTENSRLPVHILGDPSPFNKKLGCRKATCVPSKQTAFDRYGAQADNRFREGKPYAFQIHQRSCQNEADANLDSSHESLFYVL